MIKLSDLRSHSALGLLNDYNGINPYILKLKSDYLRNKKIQLTENQTNYIIENNNKEPIEINRIVRITPFIGEELKKKYNFNFLPERVLIEYILAENDKTYHVIARFTKKQEIGTMLWLPKTQVLDDPFFDEIDVEVDFNKYDEVLGKYGKKLFDHQKSGIKFLLGRSGAILADDMGLAKTCQSIIAALESGAKKILVICPSSAKINWKREISIFCDDITIVNGWNWNTAKFTIINFDILKNFHTIGDGKKDNEFDNVIQLNREIVNSNFDLLIVDEAHNLKNKNSIRGEIVTELTTKYGINKVWLLTGTPITSRPMDFYNLLRIIKAKIADNWQFYVKRYCDGKQIKKKLKNGKLKTIWLTNGASNLDELSQKTRNILLRRLKTDVLDMPDKMVTPVYNELTDNEWSDYNLLWDNYLLKRKEEKKKGRVERELVELSLLRKFIAMTSIKNTIELVETALESNKKVIIFATFTEELMELADHFDSKCVIHNGSMSDNDKQNSVDEFQNNPKIKVFIGNIISAGVAITLTKAEVVIFNSFSWVPGINDQAEDRAYRIGQNKDVNVYYQLFENTVTTRMWETLKYKSNIISQILSTSNNDVDFIEQMTDKLLEE